MKPTYWLPGTWYNYKVLDLNPEQVIPLKFRSKIKDLDQNPQWWQQECPFSISNTAMTHTRIVADEE